MRKLYSVIVALLTVSLSAWDVQAAMMVDLAPVWMEAKSVDEMPIRSNWSNLSMFEPVPGTPVQASAKIVGLFYQAPALEVSEVALESMSDMELEASLQEELIGETVSEGSFFKSKEFLGILIVTFGIGSLLAFMFGSGSGSGGTSGGGGGGGGPSTSNINSFNDDTFFDDTNFGPSIDEKTCVGDCSTQGGGGKEDDVNSKTQFPDGIPSNPEPSTFLLLGLGLLLPFLRRKV